nr:cell division cycle protein cdt2 [Quercus suber]
MASLPIFSSPVSHFGQDQILIDLEKENDDISSSPLKVRSGKLKGLPTVTPKRFTKFFTPRASLSSRGTRQSKAGRRLRDITKNGVNRGRTLGPDLFNLEGGEEPAPRAPKRRKPCLEPASSPLLHSSPLKHVYIRTPLPDKVEDASSKADLLSDEELFDVSEDFPSFPNPINRIRHSGLSQRVVTRSFGGYDGIGRSRRGPDHGVNWRAETSNFVSTPSDRHIFKGRALPFCSASCNTNSLVAFGDEEGGLRFVDSALSSKFAETHLAFRPHRNAIMDINFSADDYLLASASGDQTVRVIDMHTQKTACILTGHTSSVKQVRFQPEDENILSTSSRDGSVQVWDLRCAATGSVASLRTAFARDATVDGDAQPAIRYSYNTIMVGPAHRSAKIGQGKPSTILNSEDNAVSVTAIEHLRNGRGHLLLTASELSGSVKLWDLRNTSRNNCLPVSSTALPESHHKTRNFGINALALSHDGARLYTVCRDATVYAYSTNHLILGSAPEFSVTKNRRRCLRSSGTGIGPLYGFKHQALRTGSFYIKASLRPARADRCEMLAVGSSEQCAVVFPTDERHLQIPQTAQSEEDEMLDLPLVSAKSTSKSASSSLHISDNGTALVRGHDKEVTSLSWTFDGDLVSISDDFSARCWREDGEKARDLRTGGEGGGRRWDCGWADADAAWDDEEC